MEPRRLLVIALLAEGAVGAVGVLWMMIRRLPFAMGAVGPALAIGLGGATLLALVNHWLLRSAPDVPLVRSLRERAIARFSNRCSSGSGGARYWPSASPLAFPRSFSFVERFSRNGDPAGERAVRCGAPRRQRNGRVRHLGRGDWRFPWRAGDTDAGVAGANRRACGVRRARSGIHQMEGVRSRQCEVSTVNASLLGARAACTSLE